MDDNMVVITDAPYYTHNGADSDLEEPASTSTSQSYCAEWERLFQRPGYLRTLKAYGLQGKLRSSRFRSVCWKLYMEVLPADQSKWQTKTKEWRNIYDDLRKRLITNPRKAMDHSDLSLNNPLSQETESPWNQFFLDNELRLTIKQDVIRTFPDLLFFHDAVVRERLTDVLFIYAKEHSGVSYKQGMHELLAPLIFVLHCDHQAFLHACEIESVGLIPIEQREILKDILDPEYIEHDSYALFCQIMETVEPWYVSKEISPTMKANNVMTAQPFARHQDMHPSNVIVTKLTRIQDYLLKRYDPEMHAHLEQMDIVPQIYGIRWVRLLFGREFPMQDLLMVWDAIFADGISFDLVDHIFLAMLLYIRDAMINSDYPSCLYLLMKYPPVGDVHYFIDKALYLREPTQYPRPPEYTYQKPANFGQDDGRYTDRNGKGANPLRIAGKAATVMSGFSNLTRRINQNRPRQLFTSPNRMSKSTSEPMNLLTDQSPDFPPGPPPERRKGSTASLSQIEGGWSPHVPAMRAAVSSQSLARTEATSGGRSVSADGSMTMLDQLHSPAEQMSPGQKYMSLPGRGKKNKRSLAQDRSVDHDLAIMMARLNDMDQLCRKCTRKMDEHIGKLQSEMMKQQLDNEDELLMALAGLKQVRDILKGTLKPSSVFTAEDSRARDNHYPDDETTAYSSHRSSARSTPSAGTPVDQRGRTPRAFCIDRSLSVPGMTSSNSGSRLASPEEGAVAPKWVINGGVKLHEDVIAARPLTVDVMADSATSLKDSIGADSCSNFSTNGSNSSSPATPSSNGCPLGEEDSQLMDTVEMLKGKAEIELKDLVPEPSVGAEFSSEFDGQKLNPEEDRCCHQMKSLSDPNFTNGDVRRGLQAHGHVAGQGMEQYPQQLQRANMFSDEDERRERAQRQSRVEQHQAHWQREQEAMQAAWQQQREQLARQQQQQPQPQQQQQTTQHQPSPWQQPEPSWKEQRSPVSRPSRPQLVQRKSADSMYDPNQNATGGRKLEDGGGHTRLQRRESTPINKLTDFFKGTFSKF